jgi:hypothetical protein
MGESRRTVAELGIEFPYLFGGKKEGKLISAEFILNKPRVDRALPGKKGT